MTEDTKIVSHETPQVRTTAHSAAIVLSGPRSRAVAKEWVEKAPRGWVCSLEREPRTNDQSRKFYAICSQLAKSEVTWDGERQTKRGWHDLLIHGWMIATQQEPRLVAGLNGGRVSLMKGTSDLKVDEMSELIDLATAWAAQHGIEVV
jgi:NinB protein